MMRPNWSDWCTNLASYEAGNRNMQAYSNILEARHSEVEKIRSVIEEKDSGVLAMPIGTYFHSPTTGTCVLSD